eukprot:1705045-Prymnesium_polylepis.1
MAKKATSKQQAASPHRAQARICCSRSQQAEREGTKNMSSLALLADGDVEERIKGVDRRIT